MTPAEKQASDLERGIRLAAKHYFAAQLDGQSSEAWATLITFAQTELKRLRSHIAEQVPA